MPRNGSTNGSVTVRIAATMSLPWFATSSSRMMRRISSACSRPKANVTIRLAVVAQPGPAGVVADSVTRTEPAAAGFTGST